LVASPKNEVFMEDTIDSVFNQKSFGLTLTFTNNSNFISPVVDARRFSLYATQNRISDPSHITKEIYIIKQ